MSDVTIIIINAGDGAAARKKLKDAMPESIREVFDANDRDVEMESAETLRDKLPEGFPREFVVKEEVLVFPDEEGEPDIIKKRRRRMKELNTKMRRKSIPGNTEA